MVCTIKTRDNSPDSAPESDVIYWYFINLEMFLFSSSSPLCVVEPKRLRCETRCSRHAPAGDQGGGFIIIAHHWRINEPDWDMMTKTRRYGGAKVLSRNTDSEMVLTDQSNMAMNNKLLTIQKRWTWWNKNHTPTKVRKNRATGIQEIWNRENQLTN